MPKLTVLTEGIEPTSFELAKEVTSVGRVQGNDIVLAHQSVSGSHGELVLRGQDVYIRDLGSTNGSYIDGSKVAESPVQPGEVITFGEVQLKLEGARKVQSLNKHLEQGVKLGDLGSAPKGPAKGFTKKSDKTGRYFVNAGVVVTIILVGVIVLVVLKFKGAG